MQKPALIFQQSAQKYQCRASDQPKHFQQSQISFMQPFLEPQILPTIYYFSLAAFAGNFAENLEFQKAGVDRIIKNRYFMTYFPEEIQNRFFFFGNLC